MGFATKWKTKKLCAKEWSKRHIFLSHFFIFHHKPKRMLKCLRNGFWIVIVQKILKKCLSHSGKMHFSVSGHMTLGVVRWRHELDYICPLWVLSKFGPVEAYRCRVIANWFFPSNGIKRYFNGPLRNSKMLISCQCRNSGNKKNQFSVDFTSACDLHKHIHRFAKSSTNQQKHCNKNFLFPRFNLSKIISTTLFK